MTREQLLIQAFQLASVGEPLSCDTICWLIGRHITHGFPIKRILSKAMGDVADMCCYPSGWLSVEASQCLKASKILRGNLLATPTQGICPFVSQESATLERPSWSAILRKIPEGTLCLAIFTDESKRRLWPFARISQYGDQWRPYLNTGNACPPHIGRELCINRTRFLACLDCVEVVYSVGFSKYAILDGLLDVSSSKAIHTCGIQQTMNYEHTLQEHRGTDELLLAVFVAQKQQPIPISEQNIWQTQQQLNL